MLGYLCDSELKHTESLLTFVFVFVFLWPFFLWNYGWLQKIHSWNFFQLVQQNWICHTLMGEKQLNERSTL